jgi:hypothetical protein
VDPNLEAIIDKPLAESRRYGIPSGDKIEARAEAQVFFKFHQLAAFVVALYSIDVVGQHKGELFAVWPSGPPLWRIARLFVDGPDVLA